MKLLYAYMFAAYIQVHVRLDVIMEANTINPDQTAPIRWDQSDLVLYCLEYRLSKNIGKGQVMTGGKMVKIKITDKFTCTNLNKLLV